MADKSDTPKAQTPTAPRAHSPYSPVHDAAAWPTAPASARPPHGRRIKRSARDRTTSSSFTSARRNQGPRGPTGRLPEVQHSHVRLRHPGPGVPHARDHGGNPSPEMMAQFNPESAATLPRQNLLRVVNPSKQMFVDMGSERRRKHPNTIEKKAHQYKLYQFFEDQQYQGKQMIYTYDFGDNWTHHMSLEGRGPPTTDFKCISAQGHYVAEDVGSDSGWERPKEAYQTSNPTKEQKEKREWYQTRCSNGEKEGLTGRENEVDKFLIDYTLGGMRSAGFTNDGRRNPYAGQN